LVKVFWFGVPAFTPLAVQRDELAGVERQWKRQKKRTGPTLRRPWQLRDTLGDDFRGTAKTLTQMATERGTAKGTVRRWLGRAHGDLWMEHWALAPIWLLPAALDAAALLVIWTGLRTQCRG
jgi:hypothetical protein